MNDLVQNFVRISFS